MMSLPFRMRSEHSGAIAKRLQHAKNQLSVPGSFFNQFGIDTLIDFNSKDLYLCNELIEGIES